MPATSRSQTEAASISSAAGPPRARVGEKHGGQPATTGIARSPAATVIVRVSRSGVSTISWVTVPPQRRSAVSMQLYPWEVLESGRIRTDHRSACRLGGGGDDEVVGADGGALFFEMEADFGVVNGSLGIEGEVGEWSQ